MARRSFRNVHRKRPARRAAETVIATLGRLGLTDQARRLEITAAWAEAVGPQVAARTEPHSFNRGVLVIKSASPAWQNELTFLRQQIIARINEALGAKQTVRELKVISGSLAAYRRYEEPFAWIKEPATGSDRDVAKDAAQPIKDAQLRNEFERLVVLARRADRARRKTDPGSRKR